MRSVRMVAIGLAAAVCALGAFSATAFAKKGEKLIFGKFVASTSGTTRGTGTANKLRIGPYRFTGEELFETVEREKKHPKEPGEMETVRVPKKNAEGEIEHGPLCKPLIVKGTVEEGESESITQTIQFPHCVTYRQAGTESGNNGPLLEKVTATFSLGIKFRSNHSAETGEPEPKSAELEPGTVVFKGSHSTCKVKILEQDVPLKATEEVAENGEKEFEAALYETEEESLEGKKQAEKKFGPVRDRLAIETEFKHVKATVEETASCTSKKGGKENEEGEFADKFENGVMDLSLEHITLKNGQLSFVPPGEEASSS